MGAKSGDFMTGFQRRVWWALLPAMLVPGAAALMYFVWLSEHALARWIYAGAKLFTVAWPLVSAALILRMARPRFSLKDATHWRAAPVGLVSGLGIVALMGVLMLTPIGEMVLRSAPKIRGKAETLGFLDHYWTFALFLSVAHSFLEEYYWRWFVFGQLRRVVPRVAAHLLAGVAFAAHHVIVATQYFPLGWGIVLGGVVGIGGILWSALYERQNTLAGAWVSHILGDLGILSIGHRLLFGTYF